MPNPRTTLTFHPTRLPHHSNDRLPRSGSQRHELSWHVRMKSSILSVHVLVRDNQISLLSVPTGLDLHAEAGFEFSDFFPLPNPSGIFRDFIVQ